MPSIRLSFLCGYCRGALVAGSSAAGSAVTCPHCRAVIEVPAPVSPPPDPGFEVVDDESDPPPPPKPRRKMPAPEPDPEPSPRRTRKSSDHLRPNHRPLRLGNPLEGNATRAVLLLLLALVAMAAVVVVAVMRLPGRDGKNGVAVGGILPGIPGVEPDGTPAPPPPGWVEIEHDRIRVLVPKESRPGKETNWYGGNQKSFMFDTLRIDLGHDPSAPAGGDPLIAKIANRKKRVWVSGRLAHEYAHEDGNVRLVMIYINNGTNAHYLALSNSVGAELTTPTAKTILESFRLAD